MPSIPHLSDIMVALLLLLFVNPLDSVGDQSYGGKIFHLLYWQMGYYLIWK